MARSKRHSKNDDLIATLGCGVSVANAALATGFSERTIHRRLKEPEFSSKVDAFRADILQRTAAIVTAASQKSVQTLIRLQDPTVPPAVQLGAAKALVNLGIRLREETDLGVRVAALEQLAKQGGNSNDHGTPAIPPDSAGESILKSTDHPHKSGEPPGSPD
jgi:hypothetical protein